MGHAAALAVLVDLVGGQGPRRGAGPASGGGIHIPEIGRMDQPHRGRGRSGASKTSGYVARKPRFEGSFAFQGPQQHLGDHAGWLQRYIHFARGGR